MKTRHLWEVGLITALLAAWAVAQTPVSTIPAAPLFTLNGFCNGVVATNPALSVVNLGAGNTNIACTNLYTTGLGSLMPTSGTVVALYVSSATAGVNSSSGVFTLMLNDVAQTMTCTIGTGTACNDVSPADALAFSVGQRVGVKFSSQTAETMSYLTVGLKVILR